MQRRTERPACRTSGVVERSRGVAAAYAGRLLAAMGADVILVEPPCGNAAAAGAALPGRVARRKRAVRLSGGRGKRACVCDLGRADGRACSPRCSSEADILIDDTPVADRRRRWDSTRTSIARHPGPDPRLGAAVRRQRPEGGLEGDEINVLHASGEGFLLPNGFSIELFPDRPPLKIYGHFAACRAASPRARGAVGALGAREVGGQFVDVPARTRAGGRRLRDAAARRRLARAPRRALLPVWRRAGVRRRLRRAADARRASVGSAWSSCSAGPAGRSTGAARPAGA